MLKVIQNIKLELHRGLKVNTSDPYSYGSNILRKVKKQKLLRVKFPLHLVLLELMALNIL